MKPKSIKMEGRRGKDWKGRGKVRRGEGEKERHARREKKQKGDPRSQRGMTGANRGEQGEVYPTLKGGTPPAPQLADLSGNRASSFF